MSKKNQKCYMCDKKKESREHFPPSSFYPNSGAGMDNLQTVYSCNEHNGKKSQDDLYVLAHICLNTALGDNLAARRFKSSVLPHIEKSQKFTKLIVEDSIMLPDGARKYRVDTEKFDNFFNHLVGAIFYKKFGFSIDFKLHRVRHIYSSFQSRSGLEKNLSEKTIINLFREKFSSMIKEEEHAKTEEFVYSYSVICNTDLVKDQTKFKKTIDRAACNITIGHTFYGSFKVESFLTLDLDYYLRNHKQ